MRLHLITLFPLSPSVLIRLGCTLVRFSPSQTHTRLNSPLIRRVSPPSAARICQNRAGTSG